MAKCGVCGMELDKQPKVAQDGKCSECGKKLEMEESKKKKK